MSRLPTPVVFDWSQGNLEKNWLKHRVTNKEAEEAFFNKPLKIFPDVKHLGKEERYVALGVTNQERKLTAIFTVRYDIIRIISVRDQSKKERKQYEKS